MNKIFKKSFLVFLICLIVIACSLNLYSQNIKNYSVKTKNYQIKADYPVTGYKKIDKINKDFVFSIINNFKKSAPKKQPNPDWKNELIITCETTKFKNEIIGFKFEIYSFTGGAHGTTSVVTKNFIIKTQKEIPLKFIFKENSKWLEKLSEISFAKLKSIPGTNEKWVKEGTAPNESNFSRFLLNDSNLVIYFEPLTVAPYTAGVQKVEIPNKDLRKFFKKILLKRVIK